MIVYDRFKLWFILMSLGEVLSITFNRPTFSPYASWNPNGITFATSSIIGSSPYEILINNDNTIYIPNRSINRILIWSNNATIPKGNISINSSNLFSVFLDKNNAIYTDISSSYYGINKWSINSTNPIQMIYSCTPCYDIFIDIANNLYCSMTGNHQVLKKSLNISSYTYETVAGVPGVTGSTARYLYNPYGIFVDTNFDLYVADCSNNRIQFFPLNQFDGTTLVGSTVPGTITLSCPTDVKLDADKYLFIVNTNNHRIIGSGPNGFRCIIGCSGSGAGSNTLNTPWSMSFDSAGNIYVTDLANNRIQKFILLYNKSLPFYNTPKIPTGTTWKQDGITFADNNTIGTNPWGIYIDKNNRIYVPSRQYGRIHIWFPNGQNTTVNISRSSSYAYATFVSSNGDIYVSSQYSSSSSYYIDKLTANSNGTTLVTTSTRLCYGLFIDSNDVLYCSMPDYHQVIKIPVDAGSSSWTGVAGIAGTPSSSSTYLYNPHGIFIDTNFDLYVADRTNNRIQLFNLGITTGITVVGSAAPETITLYYPTGVSLDADKYLFIVDQYNNRIVGSGPNGFRCLVGCSGSDNVLKSLVYPSSMAFDSYGNIYVVDRNNHRIQKYVPFNNTKTPSYNTPKFQASRTWNSDGITFADNDTIGTNPWGIYIDKNNRIYVPSRQYGRIHIWFPNGQNTTVNISRSLSYAYAIFVSSNGDIYVSSQYSSSYYIDKLTANSNGTTLVTTSTRLCFGLFIDNNDVLYCSMPDYHQVVKRPLESTSSAWTSVAGVAGSYSSTSTYLNSPYEIFVDVNFDLYVADCGNDRIQLFNFGITTGITVAGDAAIGTISLDCPIGVMLDGDKYLFIVDNNYNRIVGSGPNGFRCLVGCSGSGSVLKSLVYPSSMAFDSHGNIYVTDRNNHRIQKFMSLNTTKNPSYNTPKMPTGITWDSDGITFADNNTIGTSPWGIYIDKNNTIYVPSNQYGRVHIWFADGGNVTRNISRSTSYAYAMFVTSNGDMYVSSQYSSSYYIDKLTIDGNNSTLVATSTRLCYGLFIDINDALYCSMTSYHQVVKKPLDSTSSVWTSVAGVAGSYSSTSTYLYNPYGIFVDTNFDLYVADRNNNRIQLFNLGITTGVTVVGSAAPETITLYYPTGISLDADKYLYIVDQSNHRIVGSGPNGLRCLVGCSGSGSVLKSLLSPSSMAFDSHGNIYVTDRNNHRIQKFVPANNTRMPSYNTPSICPAARWNKNAVTFANNNTIGTNPYGIYIDNNNTIYIPSRQYGRVHIWFADGQNTTINISRSTSYAYATFVSSNGDIYVSSQYSSSYYIDKLTIDGNNSTLVATSTRLCYGLFIDINDVLYCCMSMYHQVVKKPLDSTSNAWTSVAGVANTASSSSTYLNNPYGIFVDVNFDLYVADCGNDRIQLFYLGISTGITLVGTGTNGTIALDCPIAVTLDADKYLFIVDNDYNRIVGSGPNGFRCLFGCSGSSGSASNSLNEPQSMAFDSDGNIYVTDRNNHRIQKLILSCFDEATTEITTEDSKNSSILAENITISTEIPTTTVDMDIFINETSYNQPKLDPLAQWNPAGITFATSTTVGTSPYAIFINKNDTIYVANRQYDRIVVWLNSASNETITIAGNLSTPYSLFVTANGDIFTDNRYSSNRVDKRKFASNSSTVVMLVDQECFGLFVDTANNIYCSLRDLHRVVKKPVNSVSNIVTTVAGSTCSEPSSNSLSSPYGIFVDTNFDLYVADWGNNRIQLFPNNQLSGKTVAGSAANGTITLYYPVGVILDADKYLFIVDQYNHRIVGSGPNGFRCIVGCYGSGSVTRSLVYPSSMAFDSHGNIYVADKSNHRIQKFVLYNNTNVPTYNTPKFCPLINWNPSAITFANSNAIGIYPWGIYIDKNNTIYVPSYQYGRIHIWFADGQNIIKNIARSPSYAYATFVSSNGDIYVSSQYSSSYYIDKFTINGSSSTAIATSTRLCYGLFVDINDVLYCSMPAYHQVVKKPIDGTSNVWTTVAGVANTASSSSTYLRSPYGIFVDTNSDVYVADCGNNRIQLFYQFILTGVTVAGSTSSIPTFSFSCPIAVMLDADKYLFVIDNNYNRIVGSGPNGFRCLVGCYGSGSVSNTLNEPQGMAFDSDGNIYVVDGYNHRIQKFLLFNDSCVLSYNQPQFCPNSTWYAAANTYVTNSIIGSLPYGIFVDSLDTVYAVSRSNNRIYMWSSKSTTSTPTRTLSGGLSQPYSIFVTLAGDIYVDNGASKKIVSKWTENSTNSTIAMNVTGSCYGLFVDISDTIYCSLASYHKVLKSLTNNSTVQVETAAGNGSAGASADQLNSPRGIFVTLTFDLYIADCGNNRIQLFSVSQTNGITISVNTSLNCPTSVLLDRSGYIFIVDSQNHRILGSDINGFRCIVGCSMTPGSLSTQLLYPQSMSFDSYGNIYVTDRNNNRIQRFSLNKNLCLSPLVVPTATAGSPLAGDKCYYPAIIFTPGGSSTLTLPLSFRRSQDFSILATVEFNCTKSVTVKYQWVIRSCTTVCVTSVQLAATVSTKIKELYIPARALSYGTFQFELQVNISGVYQTRVSNVLYVQINPSGITANLVQLGTSFITVGYDKDLVLDPGSFSVDADSNNFNSTLWKYKYYCRIYGVSMYPNIGGILIPIDNPLNDQSNSSCLSNWSGVQYGNIYQSSITILRRNLRSNRTYQFMVQMESRRNTSNQATGYVLVRVEDTRPQLIIIGCVISTMCSPNLEYQIVNPTTQVALFALCVGNCTAIRNITWTIHFGSMNDSSNDTEWTLFTQMSTYRNIWFFGSNTSNFTATNQLFPSYPQIKFWRFQVTYSFPSETSSSALNFIINQPPVNGSCMVTPSNGTTNTLFAIICADWIDDDGLKDYSLYFWTNNPSKRTIVAYSLNSQFEVRLPTGDARTSELNLLVTIRDQLDCVAEYHLASVYVQADSASIQNLITTFQSPSSTDNIIQNPIVQLLSSGDQNTVGQVIGAVSQEFNKMNEKSVDEAAAKGIPCASISISSLGSQRISQQTEFNQSALIEFKKELNSHANVREYLLTFTNELAITTSNSIKLQSATLAQLTKATNQLSRASLNNALDRCYQLTLALHAMSSKIAYEDAQIAATQLIQCGTNILSAVNGPLQKRTSTLDLDETRASAIPDDYETDLESEWTKISKLDDKNSYYQKQTANQIQTRINQMISLLTSTLNIHINIGQDLTMNTSEVFMSLETTSLELLANKRFNPIDQAEIRLPTNFQLNITNENSSSVSIRSMVEPLASFGNSKTSTYTNLSTSISLSLIDENGHEIRFETSQLEPIEIFIPRDPNLIVPDMILQNVTSNNSIAHQQLFNLHYINLTDQHSVSIHLEIESLNRNLSYLLIYKFDRIPQLTDNWTLFCSENLSNENTFTYFIDNQQTKQHQSFIFGLRELTPNESINFCSNSTISVPIINSRHNFTSNYKLRTYTSGCYYLDTDGQWQSDGLRVGSQTNHNRTQCFSTHLTTFAGGFNVLPEPVNWQYVFANADFMKNKTIYSTVICISAIYLILLVFARHKDKKDIEKLGVTPLLDNHSEDRYYYQLIVFTGRRKNAGTKSRVQFILSGDHDETHVRTLADSKRTILQRGGIDAFVVAVPKCLGPLSHIRIWHDNSGSGEASSWFLKYILVRDLQTMEKFHFIAQRWFAVEHDDGKIERTLPVASHLEKSEFSYLLSKQAYHNVSDGHLWFSIFSRPASPRFTRVQRCTCCFVLLFVSMFLNIMYYDLKSSTNTSGLTIGPLFIGIEQIVIGIIVELCALIPSLLLVQIFRRLRSRRPSISALHQTVSQLKPNTTIKSQSSNKSFTFPWWFIFIAYGLSIILVGVSILFIIARGIEFGDTKTQQWLISIVTSFCSSVLLTQPLKILALSIVFICLCRKSDDDQTANEYLDENQLDLDDNEEYLHSKIEPIFISRSKIPTTRLDETELELARQDRLKEIRMWSVIRETLTYLIFLSLIFAITYSHRTTDTFQQVNHLRKYFRSKSIVYSINDYWTWLETNFVDKIRAQQWYNNDIPLNLNGYINDKTNRLIGWGLMRQLRIQSDLCPYDKLSLTCSFEYDKSNEETNSFEIGWLNRTITKGNTSIEKAFEYQSSQQLDSYVYQGEHGKYSGGGYVYEFRGRLSEIKNNLSELHRFGWIDTKTRAILIQLNLYNPNAQLFTSVSILTEFLSTGGTATRTRFEPMNFYLTLNSWTQLICLIVYLCFIIYLMFGQMKLIHQLKFNYLRQFWSLIELGIIICSWMAIGIYILRYREYYRIGQLFNQSKGYAYINLQYSTYLNDYLTFIYAFCCFFGTLKLVRLCRFSPRLYLFIQTLESATQKLIAFAFMFTIVFTGFICLFYFLFQSTLFSCSTILQTIRMLFEMTLMKFDVYELINVSPVLGPLAFSFFIFIVVFVCMSMFLSIINDSFQRAKENAKQDQEHIYSFMIERFLRWIDWKKQRTEDETHEEYDVRMRDQYFHPIEGFPEKVDQLFEVLNQIYVSQVDRQTKRE